MHTSIGINLVVAAVCSGYEDVASRVNGQVMIPSDASADVSANGDIPVPSGDIGPAAAAAPGPTPATIIIPELLSPDVNATWHLVDSPPGATCEVGLLSSRNMHHLLQCNVTPVTVEGAVSAMPTENLPRRANGVQ